MMNACQELIQGAVFAIVALALSPLVGLWIVALAGAALVLLPISAAVSTIFPKTWKPVEDGLLSALFPTA
jgi:hypothetical protein